ncbi:MAG TPA: hypothetical protein VH274_01220 [Mycobacteriales bacterium]|nr:hypothetical protein [Mycobacteriales bacterium]
MRHHQAAASTPSVDDLDELQIVTRREFRRGYLAQVNGRPIRLRYRKIMTTPDRQVLVSRPPAGEERRKITIGRVGTTLGLFLAVVWPVTFIVAIALLALLISALR